MENSRVNRSRWKSLVRSFSPSRNASSSFRSPFVAEDSTGRRKVSYTPDSRQILIDRYTRFRPRCSGLQQSRRRTQRERKTRGLKLRFYCAAMSVNIYLSGWLCSFPSGLSRSLINTRCPFFLCNPLFLSSSFPFPRHFTLQGRSREK